MFAKGRSLSIVVADNVRVLCARRRIHQSDLADELGMSRMAVSDRFRYRTPWTVEELGWLAQLLQVPVSMFLGEASGVVAPDPTGPRHGLGIPDRDGWTWRPEVHQQLPGVTYPMVS